MLTVTTPATTFDLTTLATVRTELGYVDSSRDAQLAAWIRQASNVVATWCNKTFASETVTETFRLKSRTAELFLARWPVTSIVSVTEGDTLLTADQYEVDAQTGVLVRLSDDRASMWCASKITVVYVAGYTLLGTLPYGIERATILLVKQYASGGDRDPLIKSETTDGLGSASYFDGELPPEVEGLLASHRKPAIG